MTTSVELKQVKRSVYRNLLFSMISFGLAVGLIFPPFAKVALDAERALSGIFFGMCLMAGLVVGLANYGLFHLLVSRELGRLAESMNTVLTSIAERRDSHQRLVDERVELTSNDAIGALELAFNQMITAVDQRLVHEAAAADLHSALSSSVELSDVANTLLQMLVRHTDASAGVLYVDSGNHLELAANDGADDSAHVPRYLTRESGPLRRALAVNEVLSFSPQDDDLDVISQTTPLGTFRPQTVTAVPVRSRQQVSGIAFLSGSLGKLDDDQRTLIDSLRTQAGPYLQNAVLHRKVQDLAALDDLTLLLNRRFGMRRLKEEFSRSVQHGVPLSVFLLDIDHFKSFNDTYGHDAGDAVLRALAQIMEAQMRSGDIVCRYGGEEFMLAAPGMGMVDAAQLGERIRRVIETTQVNWAQQALSVRVSIGVATWPVQRASVPEELITAADRALYFAKENGRNRVCFARNDELLAAGDVLTGI